MTWISDLHKIIYLKTKRAITVSQLVRSEPAISKQCLKLSPPLQYTIQWGRAHANTIKIQGSRFKVKIPIHVYKQIVIEVSECLCIWIEAEELDGVVIYNFFLISSMETHVPTMHPNTPNTMMITSLITEREESLSLGAL